MMASQVAFDRSKLPQGWTPNPERMQSSLTDSESSTKQTVEQMCRLIREGAAHPYIQGIAQHLGRWGDGSARKVCWDAFWFCKHKVRFALDENAVLAMFGEQDQVDFLMSPPVLLAMKRPAGDCDDFTMLCCSLLQCRGVKWEIVTVACDRAEPQRWSHVYCRAILPDGRRLALDPTNGRYPGWEVPAYDVYRKQYWNADGQPVDGPESIHDTRMHAYATRRRGRRGMGDDTVDSGGWWVDTLPSGSTITPPVLGSIGGGGITGSLNNSGLFGNMTPVPPLGSSGGIFGSSGGILGSSPSSASDFNWNSLISNLTKVGSQLGTIALAPKGGFITTDARGNLVVSNTGLPLSSAGSGNLIFYGLLAIAAIVAIKVVSK